MKKMQKIIAACASFAMLALSGCGTSVGASDVPVVPSEGDVTIRLGWWGGDSRIRATEQAVEAFEKEHRNIHVQTEYSDWTGYWDKLAVQSAGGNAPDVMQMDELYLSFYGGMNALLDLNKAKEYLDLSGIDSNLLDMGQLDGKQVAAPLSTAQFGVIVNNDVLESLGLSVPDTVNSWTWDEFEEFARQIVERSDGEVLGANAPSNGYSLQLWARQNGEQLFKGNIVAISPHTLAQFLEIPAKWVSDGIEVSKEAWSENVSASLNDSAFGKGQQAMMLTQVSQITAYAQAAGTDNMSLLPIPQNKAGNKTNYLKPGMYWCISSGSQHPAEAAMLVDYLLNDKNVGEIFGTERGVPANAGIRKDLSATASGTDKLSLDFVDEIASTLGKAPEVTPNGASDLDKLIVRYQQDVVFGKQKPLAAAKAMIKELQESIDFNS
jgi:multiple sugar transport system substrate-binding protein